MKFVLVFGDSLYSLPFAESFGTVITKLNIEYCYNKGH